MHTAHHKVTNPGRETQVQLSLSSFYLCLYSLGWEDMSMPFMQCILKLNQEAQVQLLFSLLFFGLYILRWDGHERTPFIYCVFQVLSLQLFHFLLYKNASSEEKQDETIPTVVLQTFSGLP